MRRAECILHSTRATKFLISRTVHNCTFWCAVWLELYFSGSLHLLTVTSEERLQPIAFHDLVHVQTISQLDHRHGDSVHISSIMFRVYNFLSSTAAITAAMSYSFRKVDRLILSLYFILSLGMHSLDHMESVVAIVVMSNL